MGANPSDAKKQRFSAVLFLFCRFISPIRGGFIITAYEFVKNLRTNKRKDGNQT